MASTSGGSKAERVPGRRAAIKADSVTVLLTSKDVEGLATGDLAMQAMRQAFQAEADGRTQLPVRLDVPSPQGFLRVMPAVLDGVMGCKIMTLVRGYGTRYLVMLYDVENGAPVAMVDADVLTKVRTAAVTALAATCLVGDDLVTIGLLGTGFEARGHIQSFVEQFPTLETVHAFSRSLENRQDFARWCESTLDLEVQLCNSADAAAAEAPVTLLATKSSVAVVEGSAFPPGAVVLSIGSTRPDLRELDETCFMRASVVVMDAPETVMAECGDVSDARGVGALTEDRIISLAEVIGGADLPEPTSERDIKVFKSAGTALQDLALASALHERAAERGYGTDVGEVSRLKPFLG